jgi:hypothetical protein
MLDPCSDDVHGGIYRELDCEEVYEKYKTKYRSKKQIRKYSA